VLIVDDDRAFRRVARDLLAAAGLEVVAEAVDGSEALAAVERVRPDAVLLDVHLPDTDGFALARSLRDGGRRMRVLLTSTDASAESWGDLEDAARSASWRRRSSCAQTSRVTSTPDRRAA